MFSDLNVMEYFKEVASSTRFQIAAAISFGIALLLIWLEADAIRIFATVLFLFPLSMLTTSLVEKIYTKICKWQKRDRKSVV